MGQLIINRHNFDAAKQKLQEFSEQDLKDLSLEKVDENKSLAEFLFGGGLGLDHRVTGEELNKLITKLQEILILLRDRQNSTIKAFSTIVTAVDSLDKDYIENIVTALSGLEKLGSDIQIEQNNLEEIVNAQQLTYNVLLQYKEKLSHYEHLDDVDTMWEKLQESSQVIDAVQEILQDISSVLALHAEQLNGLKDIPSRAQEIRKDLDNTTRQLQQLTSLREEVADQKNIILTLQTALDAEKQNTSALYQALSKKNRLVAILAGSAVFLFAAEFLLLVAGVL